MKLLYRTDEKNTWLYTLNSLLVLLILVIQFFIISFYHKIPFYLVIIDSICISFVYVFTVLSHMNTTIGFNIATKNLKQITLYNQSLKKLHDSERAFKHDFSNIMQSIGGYINNEDMSGLKLYYSQLFDDCQKLNNLYVLSPEVINNPGVYNLLSSKYNKAEELGITVHFDVFLNLNELNMKIYEFSRILGILIDNAIEAASECNEKLIHVEMRKDTSRNRQLLIIENTYLEKNIDIDRIFQKGFSSKAHNTGLGLWEVRNILKKNTNLNLDTSHDGHFFKQQLEIYDTAKAKKGQEVT